MTSDGNHTYQWDAEQKLISVDNGSAASYVYNALGERVQRDVGGTVYDSQYDLQGRRMAFGVGGSAWEDFLYAGDRLAALYYSGTTGFVHPNVLGSSEVISDPTGAETQDELYYPWGERWQVAGVVKDERFAGMAKRDGESGLDRTPNRMYTSMLGRWMTPDPLGGDVTNPQSLNRYAYVLNNPTSLTDPLGLYNPTECGESGSTTDPRCFGGNSNCDSLDPWYPCYYNGPYGRRPEGGGGGAVGGGGTVSSTPPAGQPPLAGNSFVHDYPCLKTGQIEELVSELLAAGGKALGGIQLNGPDGNVIGGAQNVLPNATLPNPIYVSPSVLAQSQAADPLEQFHGWKRQLIVPDTHLPGPGNVVHILFNPGPANAAGQVGITAIEIHADISAQQDVSSIVHHGWSDVFLAPWSSAQQHGCAVKFF